MVTLKTGEVGRLVGELRSFEYVRPMRFLVVEFAGGRRAVAGFNVASVR